MEKNKRKEKQGNVDSDVFLNVTSTMLLYCPNNNRIMKLNLVARKFNFISLMDSRPFEQKDDTTCKPGTRQLMDPRPSGGLDINEASVSDEKNQEGSVSPANTTEVMSNESEHHKIPSAGKKTCFGEGPDQGSTHSWGSPKSPTVLDPSKSEEQASEVPFRKARVSVRARSEAPLVCNN